MSLANESSVRTVAPTVANVAMACYLALGAYLLLCTQVTWTPIVFFLRWYHGLVLGLGVIALSIGTASWCFRKGKARAFALLPLLGMIVFCVLLVVSLTPSNDYQRFILQCASVRRGESIEAVKARMAAWGRPATDTCFDGPVGVQAFHSNDASNEQFLLFYDEATGRIADWRFIHD